MINAGSFYSTLRPIIGNSKGHEAELHWFQIKGKVASRKCLAETTQKINGLPVLTLLSETYGLPVPVVEIVTAPYSTEYAVVIEELRKLFNSCQALGGSETKLTSILNRQEWLVKRDITVLWDLHLECFQGFMPKAIHTTIDCALDESLLPYLRGHSSVLLQEYLNIATPIEAIFMWSVAGICMHERLWSIETEDLEIFGAMGKNFLGALPRFPIASLLLDANIDTQIMAAKTTEVINKVLPESFPGTELFKLKDVEFVKSVLDFELKSAAKGQRGKIAIANTLLAPKWINGWKGAFEIRHSRSGENSQFGKQLQQLLLDSMPWEKISVPKMANVLD